MLWLSTKVLEPVVAYEPVFSVKLFNLSFADDVNVLNEAVVVKVVFKFA